MNEQIIEFFQLLDDACDAIGKPRKTESAKMLFIEVAGSYGVENLKGALMAHLRDPERGRFVPTPADLIEKIQKAMEKDGRPTADEAFAIAVQMDDEYTTVVTNDEISQAWAVAREIMPDRTGARMAFRSAYERLVSQSRSANKPVQWFASLGHDKQGREGPLMQAAQLGRLSMNQVQHLLPAPEQIAPAVALLVNEMNQRSKPEVAQAALLALKSKLKGAA